MPFFSKKKIKKKLTPHNQLGIGWYNEGICLVKILYPDNAAPVLDLCEFVPNHEISTALPKLVKRYSLKRLPCVGVMELGSYQLFLREAPPVPDNELAAAMRWQVQEFVDVENAIIDVFDVPSHNMQKRMLYVVVAHGERVQAHLKTLLRAGFKLIALDIPELALRNIATLLPEDKEGVALLWLTDDYQVLTITCNATLYLTRTFQIETTLLKEQIQQSLTYYENYFNQAPINHLVIASQSPSLQDDFAMTVRYLDLNELVFTDLTMAQQAQCFPMLGAALRNIS